MAYLLQWVMIYSFGINTDLRIDPTVKVVFFFENCPGYIHQGVGAHAIHLPDFQVGPSMCSPFRVPTWTLQLVC